MLRTNGNDAQPFSHASSADLRVFLESGEHVQTGSMATYSELSRLMSQADKADPVPSDLTEAFELEAKVGF